ncbi:methylthioribose-1-phosphate isomerase-like [Argiope bruennichi]|uniref:Methylthioribose-1-phosphate isomerase n=1 Tax=Argiope bruennichi TaxID=94029 RepID=A0A8T0FRN2_ARGBR|nr:methylthioribose-1-phosphate isomerase-like [Argiope bruennichi]KAF8793282.1 Methylthioribose-1-phosphate isomerase like protein [Argiope bruennichi]
MLEAILYQRGKLEILDQLLLPAETSYDNITSVQEGWDAIKSMKVRGAPAISIVAALSLAIELVKKDFSSKYDLHDFIIKNLNYLLTSRPTAVNLSQVVKLITSLSEQYLKDDSLTENAIKERLLTEMEKLLASDIRINKSIGEYGGKHILENCSKPINILTHCNTGSLATAGYGTALGVIRWLHQNNELHQAFCTETRPYNQGARLTAYELVHDKIPSTLICDSMVASLMKSGKVSAVIVGADRVVLNGDTANKIGTYQIAVCAKYHNIPFYVACPRSTLDFSLESGNMIPIEERPSQELLCINKTRIAAEGINCWNPAFDVTPASLITGGIITEIGVFSPSSLKDNIEKLSNADLFK